VDFALTVIAAGTLVTPLYEALICVVPEVTPLTVPALTDAIDVLDEFQIAPPVTIAELLSEYTAVATN
jgi:hypothetical protein